MKSLSLNSLSPRERLGLLAALVLVLGVLGYYLVFHPLRRQFASLMREQTVVQKQLARNLRLLSPEIRDGVDRDRARYGDYIRKRMSTAEESADMLSGIEIMASRAGLRMMAMRPREPKIGDFSEEYAVEIEVEGEMAGMYRFLYELQGSPQLLRVEHMNLDSKGRTDSALLRGTLLISKVLTV